MGIERTVVEDAVAEGVLQLLQTTLHDFRQTNQLVLGAHNTKHVSIKLTRVSETAMLAWSARRMSCSSRASSNDMCNMRLTTATQQLSDHQHTNCHVGLRRIRVAGVEANDSLHRCLALVNQQRRLCKHSHVHSAREPGTLTATPKQASKQAPAPIVAAPAPAPVRSAECCVH